MTKPCPWLCSLKVQDNLKGGSKDENSRLSSLHGVYHIQQNYTDHHWSKTIFCPLNFCNVCGLPTAVFVDTALVALFVKLKTDLGPKKSSGAWTVGHLRPDRRMHAKVQLRGLDPMSFVATKRVECSILAQPVEHLHPAWNDWGLWLACFL
jgi:hypothetical protein